MNITAANLKQIMRNAAKNVSKNPNFKGYTFEQIFIYMLKYAEEFDINTALRWSHFLAQIAHESAELRYSEEIASGKAYDTGKLAVRLGNTPQADGDGQKYKGRGLIQITGRANYEAYKKYCGFDVVTKPQLLAQPVGAIRSAMWFWKTNGCNQLADNGDVEALTRRINGGLNGLAQRKFYLGCFKKEFGL
jgi:putative chitinase